MLHTDSLNVDRISTKNNRISTSPEANNEDQPDYNIPLNTLKNAIASLELKSTQMARQMENFHKNLVQSDEKNEALEKKVHALNMENTCLKAMINEVKKELNDLKRSIKGNTSGVLKRDPVINNTPIRSSLTKESLLSTPVNRNNAHQESFYLEPYNGVTESLLQTWEGNKRQNPLIAGTFDDNIRLSLGSEFQNSLTETPILSHTVLLNNTLEARNNSSSPQNEVSFAIANSRNGLFEHSKTFSIPPTFIKGKAPVPALSKPVKSFSDAKDVDSEIFEPKRIFENFFVMSIPKEKAIENISKDQNNSYQKISQHIGGEIMFNFAKHTGLETNICLDGLGDIIASNKLPFMEYITESEIDRIFYKAAFEAGSFKDKFICPLENQVSQEKWSVYADAVNPHNKLYAICIQKEDYYVIQQTEKRSRFFQIDTIYCILTYCSIPELLFGYLTSILNLIRRERREIYWGMAKKDRAKIDFGTLDTLFYKDVTAYLQELLELGMPSPCKIIKYSLNNDKKGNSTMQEYRFPEKQTAYCPLITWNASKTFAIFGLSNIRLLLNAILLEKSIVIFSTDLTLLTSVINTFLGLAFPVKYSCPIIPLLSPDRMDTCDSPVPIIAGVNRDSKEFWEERLTLNTQCIFVFLDNKTIFLNEKSQSLTNFPMLDFDIKNFKDIYTNVNPTETKFEVITSLKTLKEKHAKTAKTSMSATDALDSKQDNALVIQQIFNHFRDYLETKVLPYRAYLTDDSDNTEIKNVVKNENIRQFYYAFKGTMGYNNYPYSINTAYKQE